MANQSGSIFSRKNRQNRQADVWNVFVQVFTHLIGILCFIAVVNVVRYEVIATNNLNAKEKCEKQLYEDANSEKAFWRTSYNLQKSLMDLQRQKLVIAFSKVMENESRRIGLNEFPSGDRVRLNKIRIEDKDFKNYTQKSAQVFASEQDIKKKLYRAILEESGYTEKDNNYEVRDWHEGDTQLPTDNKSIHAFDAESTQILSANRAFIQNILSARLAKIKEDIIKIQAEVIKRIFSELENQEEAIDNETREFLKVFTNPDANEQQRDNASKAYLVANGNKIKVLLKRDDFQFLIETWHILGVTN